MPTCPFCQRVMQVAENLKVDFDLKDISEDEETRLELIEKGGNAQVPYLVDTEKEVAMYESNDIIEYIRVNYANSGASTPVAAKPRVHVSSSVCESCEG
jgi:glutathione S-transferase